MVSHPLPKNMPANLKDILWKDYSIEVPIFEWKDDKYIRVSIHGYNDRSDIKKLIYALNKQLL
jgi:selenocysteine lyase/cysteine desulfurase